MIGRLVKKLFGKNGDVDDEPVIFQMMALRHDGDEQRQERGTLFLTTGHVGFSSDAGDASFYISMLEIVEIWGGSPDYVGLGFSGGMKAEFGSYLGGLDVFEDALSSTRRWMYNEEGAALVARGMERLREGNYPQALECFESLERADPLLDLPLALIPLTRYLMGDVSASASFYERVRAICSKMAIVFFALAPRFRVDFRSEYRAMELLELLKSASNGWCARGIVGALVMSRRGRISEVKRCAEGFLSCELLRAKPERTIPVLWDCFLLPDEERVALQSWIAEYAHAVVAEEDSARSLDAAVLIEATSQILDVDASARARGRAFGVVHEQCSGEYRPDDRLCEDWAAVREIRTPAHARLGEDAWVQATSELYPLVNVMEALLWERGRPERGLRAFGDLRLGESAQAREKIGDPQKFFEELRSADRPERPEFWVSVLACVELALESGDLELAQRLLSEGYQEVRVAQSVSLDPWVRRSAVLFRLYRSVIAQDACGAQLALQALQADDCFAWTVDFVARWLRSEELPLHARSSADISLTAALPLPAALLDALAHYERLEAEVVPLIHRLPEPLADYRDAVAKLVAAAWDRLNADLREALITRSRNEMDAVYRELRQVLEDSKNAREVSNRLRERAGAILEDYVCALDDERTHQLPLLAERTVREQVFQRFEFWFEGVNLEASFDPDGLLAPLTPLPAVGDLQSLYSALKEMADGVSIRFYGGGGAGALAGTVVMPGIGTVVGLVAGARVGDMLNRGIPDRLNDLVWERLGYLNQESMYALYADAKGPGGDVEPALRVRMREKIEREWERLQPLLCAHREGLHAELREAERRADDAWEAALAIAALGRRVSLAPAGS